MNFDTLYCMWAYVFNCKSVYFPTADSNLFGSQVLVFEFCFQDKMDTHWLLIGYCY
jgi:hypothetical protein